MYTLKAAFVNFVNLQIASQYHFLEFIPIIFTRYVLSNIVLLNYSVLLIIYMYYRQSRTFKDWRNRPWWWLFWILYYKTLSTNLIKIRYLMLPKNDMSFFVKYMYTSFYKIILIYFWYIMTTDVISCFIMLI